MSDFETIIRSLARGDIKVCEIEGGIIEPNMPSGEKFRLLFMPRGGPGKELAEVYFPALRIGDPRFNGNGVLVYDKIARRSNVFDLEDVGWFDMLDDMVSEWNGAVMVGVWR